MSPRDSDSLSHAVEGFADSRVLCLGDLILDHFIYGEVSRISPESPVPILSVTREDTMLGGAGNVVRNIAALGGHVVFISVIGDDDAGASLTSMVGEDVRVEAYLTTEKRRISTVKTRYIAQNQQLLRADKELTDSVSTATSKKSIKLAKSALKDCAAVIISDYAKGMLTPEVLKEVIAAAQKKGRPVVVDPKGNDFSIYAGATVITPNQAELERVAGAALQDDAAVIKAAKALMRKYDFAHVLVTRNQAGMTLVSHAGEPAHFPAIAREVYDVSGAGDTVVATLATALGAGMELKDAVFLANVAAGIVVGRIGTAVVHRTDLKTALLTHDLVASARKILPQASAYAQITHWRDDGAKIGFTNGCFDLIHPGHVSLIEQAKGKCDRLIVGLNSDDSVRRLKGENRPVQNEMARAAVLASLEAVDMVILFRDDTPMELITAIRPDVLVKGADYTKEEVVGGEFVTSYGGKVFLAPLSKGHSTSTLVKKIAS